MSGIRTESVIYRSFRICLTSSAIISWSSWKWMETQLHLWKGSTTRDDTIYPLAIIFTKTFPWRGENSNNNTLCSPAANIKTSNLPLLKQTRGKNIPTIPLFMAHIYRVKFHINC